MKKKLLVALLSIVFAMSLCFGINAFALDEAKTALNVVDVNYNPNYANCGGPCIAINFGVPTGADWARLDSSKLKLIDKNGNDIAIGWCDVQGNYVMVNRNQTRVVEVGDILTIQEGFGFGDYEMKETVSYCYETANAPLVLCKNPLSVVDVNYTPNYATFAGPCVAINFGVNTGADWATVDTSKLKITDKDGNDVPITFCDSQGNYVLVNRSQTRVIEEGDVITIEEGFGFGEYKMYRTLHYAYQTANSPLVLLDKNTADIVSIEFTNYGGFAGDCIAVDFGFHTGADWAPLDSSKIKITDKDGNDRPITQCETQGTYVLVNRYNPKVCEEGDIITFQKGFTFENFEVKEDISYKFINASTAWERQVAEKTNKEINVSGVFMDTSWNAVSIEFSNSAYAENTHSSINAANHVIVKDADGNTLTLNGVYTLTNHLYAFVSDGAGGNTTNLAKGTTVTITAGCQVAEDEETKEDVTYTWNGSAWNKDVEEREELTVSQVTYTDGIMGSAENPTGYGNGILLSVNVDAGNYFKASSSENLEFTDKNGTAKVIATVETCGTSVAINRGSASVEDGDIITIKAGFIYADYEAKKDYKFTYTAATNTWELFSLDLAVAEVAGQSYPYDIFLLNNTNWAAPSIQIHFNSTIKFANYTNLDKEYIEYKTAYGEALVPHTFLGLPGDQTYALIRFSDTEASSYYYAMVGDMLILKAGLSLGEGETLKQDMKFIVVNKDGIQQLAPYTDALAGKTLTITTTDDYKQISVGANAQMTYNVAEGYGTPYFTVSDETKATVTKEGLVTAIAEGDVVITAHMNGETADFNITIIPAVDIAGVEVINKYTVYVVKGETVVVPDMVAHIKFVNDTYGAEFEVVEGENLTLPEIDTSVVGTQKVNGTIVYQAQNYTVEYTIEVYEIGDVSIKEVGIVDWFSYALFIQYPNSTANMGNITDTSKIDGVIDHISYARADGTPVTVNGYYMLGGGNIALFLFNDLTIDNYNEYYLAGDVLTMSAGMKIWMWTGSLAPTATDNNAIANGTGMYICEGILKEDVAMRYDGNVWALYVEYTDITAASENLTVLAGKSVDAGISKVPSNATTGTYEFTSSDTSVATVSARGVIKGVAAGTCTINVKIDGGTAGEKTLTLNVTVTDEIVGIEFEAESINVTLNGSINASNIKATYKWASGKKGETVDLTNATILGFDPAVEGEQTVVFVVTVGDKEYSGSITVNVTKKGGCFGAVSGINAGICAIAMAACAFVICRKKQSV